MNKEIKESEKVKTRNQLKKNPLQPLSEFPAWPLSLTEKLKIPQNEQGWQELKNKREEQAKICYSRLNRAIGAYLVHGDKKNLDNAFRDLQAMIRQNLDLVNGIYKNVVDSKMENLRRMRSDLIDYIQVMTNQTISLKMQVEIHRMKDSEARNKFERIINLAEELKGANADNSELLTEIESIIEETTETYNCFVNFLEDTFAN